MLKRLLFIRGAELIALAILATIPLTVSNTYVLGLLTLLAIYGILLIGLDVTVGYLGQVNLAHAAFLGLGAYAAGLSVSLLGFGMLGALAVSMAIGLILGGLLAFFLSMMIFVIVALDAPLRGETSVSPDVYVKMISDIN